MPLAALGRGLCGAHLPVFALCVQVISPVEATGVVEVISGLHEVQEKTYDTPTVLIAEQVGAAPHLVRRRFGACAQPRSLTRGIHACIGLVCARAPAAAAHGLLTVKCTRATA